jgi:hypothetical protein
VFFVKLYLFTLAVSFGIASLTTAADDNPFKSAQVGDWVEYKLVSKIKDPKDLVVEATQKMTVTAKTDKTATIKVVTKIKESESSVEIPIDLTKPFEVTQSPVPEPMPKSPYKLEKLKEGTDQITAVGKKFDCTFTKTKISGTMMKAQFDTEVTVWVSKAVPLAGMVKLEMKAPFADMTMELSGYEKK